MVAQSFDGAATMAGIKSGVAKRFIEKIPHAVFVHCYAHKLKISLQDATNQLYKYLVTFLEIVDDDNDKVIGATARGFLKQVKSFNYIFYCNILLLGARKVCELCSH